MRSTIRPPVDPNTAGSAVENLDPATTTTAPTGAGKNTEATGAEEKEPFLGLKPTQLIGGALASCTAAVLGGQLGVAGTVAGAALTSLTIAVGGAVYTRTFDKTKDGIDTAVSKFRLAGTPPVTNPAAAVSPDDDPTRVHAIQAYAAPDDPTRIVAAQAVAKTEADQATPWFRRFSLVKVLAAAAALFIIAAVAVTGLEALRGSSVSGGEGTTISQIQRGDVTTSHSRTTPTEPAAEPSQDPAAGEPTPTPTGEATPQAGAEPTSPATPAPTEGTSEPTTAPTTEPTTGATTAPTTDPGTGGQAPAGGAGADSGTQHGTDSSGTGASGSGGGAGSSGTTGTGAGADAGISHSGQTAG